MKERSSGSIAVFGATGRTGRQVVTAAREDRLDVEAEPGDARDDQRGGFGIAAVDQHVTLGPREQEDGDAGGADVVEVASDA